MNVTPIRDPLPGERVVGVSPVMRPMVEAGWRRRLRLFTGRALSDTALQMEQAQRAGHLALGGQRVSHGVVRGLEVALELREGEAFFHLAPGYGLCASGEDVVVRQAERVALADLWMHRAPGRDPASPRSGPPSPPELEKESALDRLRAALDREPLPRPLPTRLVGPARSLAGDQRPRVAVLLLEPVVLELYGSPGRGDPCEPDPRDDAFADWQLADGCRLVLYEWPWPEHLPPRSPAWRNELAYQVFEMESRHGPGDFHPWELKGLPIGLIGFDEAGLPEFVDGYAVVRAGGKPRRRSALLPDAGNPFLWQARLQQFAEQLAEVDWRDASAAEVLARFRYLPPAGVLPRAVADLVARRGDAFPDSFRVEAAPVPLEQLDAAMEASAGLEPFRADAPERLRLLVAVPQSLYEPRLLLREAPDRAFQEALDQFVAERADWLLRRENVRRKAEALFAAIHGERKRFADPSEDPLRLEDGELSIDPTTHEIAPPEEDFGTEPGVERLRRAVPLRELSEELARRNVLRAEELAKLEELGVRRFLEFLDARMRKANDTADFGFLRVQADMYRLRQLMMGETAASRLATSPALAGIVKGESALGVRQKLLGFLETVKPSAREEKPATAAPDTRKASAPAPEIAATGLFFSPMVLHTAFLQPEQRAAEAAKAPTQDVAPAIMKSARRAVLTEREAIAAETGVTRPIGRVPTPVLKEHVWLKSPLVGEAYDFRTATVGERLDVPEANEARSFAVLTKYEIVREIAELEIAVGGLLVPGILVEETETRGGKQVKVQRRVSMPLRELMAGDKLATLVLNESVPPDGDESAFFSVAVAILDSTIGALRHLEGVVTQYMGVVEACRAALDRLEEHTRAADRRLKVIEDELAEARHDVAVARALLKDEEERVKAINARRALVLRDHVPFLAYHRPRLAHADLPLPARPLDPAFVQSPVPACLSDPADAPPALRAMVELLREAPVCWFPRMAELLYRLDRPEVLLGTVRNAKRRAERVREPETLDPAGDRGQTLIGGALLRSVAAQRRVVARHRERVAGLDLADFGRAAWAEARRRAEETISIGDLIDASHGRTGVDQGAARELDDILRVATCLYEHFSEVPPRVRLGWAEGVSQYDEAVSLRNLYSLPRWGEIPYLDRRAMQALVDWLYERVDPRQAEAGAMLSELVRVCLLLASHSPVGQILAGAAVKQSSARVGETIELSVDPARVRVGMPVLVYDRDQRPVHAVVEDLVGGVAVSRVLQASTPLVTIAAGARAQFGAQARAGAPGRTGR